jgi:hypothetical protein
MMPLSNDAEITATFDAMPLHSGRNYSALGIPLILAAAGGRWGTLALLSAWLPGTSPWIPVVVTVVAIGIGLVGLGVQLLGGAFAASVPMAQVDWAIGRLTEQTDDAERLKAALTLLKHARYSGGAWELPTFDPAEVRTRLGSAIADVEAVELFLYRHQRTGRVFTQD